MKVAILHEGQAGKSADYQLLNLLLEKLQLNASQFEFFGVGSKSNFFKADTLAYVELLPLIEADQIVKVLFVMDADFAENDTRYGGFENTLHAYQNRVAQLDIAAISDIFIACDPRTKQGYIESLLMSTLDAQQTSCIEAFLACSNFSSKNNDKAILNKIYKIAYPNAPYDLEHAHFDEIKSKLRALVSDGDNAESKSVIPEA